MHFFAIVILLPYVNEVMGAALSEFEMAVVICAPTSGIILAYKWADTTTERLGTRMTLNFGFLVVLSASIGLW